MACFVESQDKIASLGTLMEFLVSVVDMTRFKITTFKQGNQFYVEIHDSNQVSWQVLMLNPQQPKKFRIAKTLCV